MNDRETVCCPHLEKCEIPVEEDEFYKNCIGDWKECFINSSKLPREWYKEEFCLKEEKKSE